MDTLRTLRSVIDDAVDTIEQPRAEARREVLIANELPSDLAENTLVLQSFDGSIAVASNPSEIARKFGYLLLRAVGNETYARIINLNLAHNDGSCASHDFCDANLIMEAAFRQYDIELPDADDADADADLHAACTDLWNTAWDLWKADPIGILAL